MNTVCLSTTEEKKVNQALSVMMVGVLEFSFNKVILEYNTLKIYIKENFNEKTLSSLLSICEKVVVEKLFRFTKKDLNLNINELKKFIIEPSVTSFISNELNKQFNLRICDNNKVFTVEYEEKVEQDINVFAKCLALSSSDTTFTEELLKNESYVLVLSILKNISKFCFPLNKNGYYLALGICPQIYDIKNTPLDYKKGTIGKFFEIPKILECLNLVFLKDSETMKSNIGSIKSLYNL